MFLWNAKISTLQRLDRSTTIINRQQMIRCSIETESGSLSKSHTATHGSPVKVVISGKVQISRYIQQVLQQIK